jgi:hypothetical protein
MGVIEPNSPDGDPTINTQCERQDAQQGFEYDGDKQQHSKRVYKTKPSPPTVEVPCSIAMLLRKHAMLLNKITKQFKLQNNAQSTGNYALSRPNQYTCPVMTRHQRTAEPNTKPKSC